VQEFPARISCSSVQVIRQNVEVHVNNIIETLFGMSQGIVFSAAVLFPAASFGQASAINTPSTHVSTSEDRVKSSHGTVNVILASHGTIVAVTDSMLSFANPEGHEPTGIKLFKIDDRTVCTMAGLYSESGFANMDSLTLLIPKMMQTFISDVENRPDKMQFWYKAAWLQYRALNTINSHLNALQFSHSDLDVNSISPLELTLVGYDDDNLLRIADITLYPRKTGSLINFVPGNRPKDADKPLCSLSTSIDRVRDPFFNMSPFFNPENTPVVRFINEAFFCEIAGIPHVAEEILNSPGTYGDIQAIHVFIEANKQGRYLRLEEVRNLAIELERQTALSESQNGKFRVGGNPQITILQNGKVVESPTEGPKIPSTLGEDLGGMLMRNPKTDCGQSKHPGMVIGPGITTIQIVQGLISNCNYDLDGLMFTETTFTNDQVYYSGRAPLLFAPSNIVNSSSLHLGEGVDFHNEQVKHLACDFPWTAIYRGSKEITFPCGQLKH
jgi:hypothetical protein